jgi:hypothetical protein
LDFPHYLQVALWRRRIPMPGAYVTFVITILHEGEWNPDWGGGADLNRPGDE